MCKRVLCLIVLVICAENAMGASLAPNDSSISENLCLWLRLPDTNYDPATETWTDSSGKGNDAAATVAGFAGPTLSSGENPTVFSRPFATVHFDTQANDLLKAGNLNGGNGLTDLTILYVINLIDDGTGDGANADVRAVGIGSRNDGSAANNFNLAYDATIRKDNGYVSGSTQTFPRGEFVIHAARMTPDKINMWFNSTGTLEQVFDVSGSSYTTSTDQLYMGDVRYELFGEFEIAELVVFNTSLTDEQVESVSQWLQDFVGIPTTPAAYDNSPAYEATDVYRDAVLSWSPVETAVTRDVYFGTVFDDVNDATRDNPRGVLVSQDQTATTFDPGRLEFNQTYYWRVDEVNGAPDYTVFKGYVWSFTTELLAYPIENIMATSNASSLDDQGPQRLVDGSGLDEEDRHSIDIDDMWGGSPVGDDPITLQFEFDRLYKLHEMLAWNYNMNFEAILGYGVKEATIEYSADGVDWTVLGDVELTQAPGSADYTFGDAIALGGIAAKYVRMTVKSNFGGSTAMYGLSEVRFTYVPVSANLLSPADGAADLSVDTTFTWSPGREADVHELYLDTDPNALDVVDSTTATTYGPISLDLDTTYYWQVVEVNEAEAVSTWGSDLWSFTTQESIVIDDFESYIDDPAAGDVIWEVWIDGWVEEGGDPDNGGSVVGNINSPFAEQTIVHGGGQSMPIFYTNDGTPAISEADYAFPSAQDWTVNGIQSLVLYVHGDSGNIGGGQLYAKIDETKVTYDSVSDVLQRAQWMIWPIDLASTGANLSNITSISVGVEGAGASGVLFVDDIRLYGRTAELIEPTLPSDSDPNLVAYYSFDGNVDDSVGSYDLTIAGSPGYESGLEGQAINVNGINDSAVLAFTEEVLWPACSVSVWVKAGELAQDTNSSVFNNNSSSLDFQLDTDGGDPGIYRYHGSIYLYAETVTTEWVHLATRCDGVDTSLYYNGIKVDTGAVADTNFGQIAFGINRAGDNWFSGVIDEARLYNRPLSDGEVAGLAGITEPIVGSF